MTKQADDSPSFHSEKDYAVI